MFKHLIACTLLASLVALIPTGAPAAPKRIQGERCDFPRVAAGAWVGFFDGYETTSRFVSREDEHRPVRQWRCFRIKADCTAWKYWMQTDYRASQTWCRRR
jgi:hypothetical protein